MRRRAFLLPLLLLAGCVNLPDGGHPISEELRHAPYPKLIPLDFLRADPAPDPAAEAERVERGLDARRQALKARAAQLSQPVLDSESSARLRRGIAE